MTDVLSEILQHIRLAGCVYFQRDFHAPWAMKIEDTGFAQFHVITHGSCVVTCEGTSHDCSTGDVLLFPHSMGHVLCDKAGRKAISGPEVMASFEGDAPMFSEGDHLARIICGHYEYQSNIIHPLISDLPEFIHIKAMDVLGETSNISVLSLILHEMAKQEPGQSLIVERCAEILLIQILRSHYAQSPEKPGFYSGLANQRLARAVSQIHRDFSSRLTLSDLAETAAMSRSAFAQRFKQLTRISPIEYLAKWRMINAGDYLKNSDKPVGVVAEQVGYDSEISFARAFKREYGVTPSSFRKSG